MSADPMMRIALADAANNCARDGGTAIITLRSGVQIEGQLERSSDRDTAHVKTRTGWATIHLDEIAVVEAARR